MTRRDFLKSTGAAIAGSAALSPALQAAAQSPAGAKGDAAAGMVRVTLDINGERRTLDVEPQATLAEVLRGPLNLPGTKIGCDRGACSACTVLIDRAPALSCMTLAVDVGERKVVTVEGLARGTELHPVQAAFVEHDAIQCGFCTPGLVMTCVALVESKPDCSANDVSEAIEGHLCRCGVYPHVIEAVLDVTKSRKG